MENTPQTPEELRARATQLRRHAAATDIEGCRQAWLTLAERYEAAAAASSRPELNSHP